MNPVEEARRRAIARLFDAQEEGLMPVQWFEERFALLREAESVAMIDAIVADLPTDPHLEAVALESVVDDPALPTLRARTPVPAGTPESIRIPSILGSSTRAGQWTVPEHLELLVILGELKLDFRDALFTSDTTVIDLSVTLGSVTITVPHGTQVENECREVLSSSSQPKPKGGRSGIIGDLLVIRGSLILSELTIKEAPAPGWRKKPGVMERLGLASPDDVEEAP